MLWRLLYSFHEVIKPFRVFRYITFRTAAAFFTALLICLVLGPWLIGSLREFQIGQQIREEGPTSHRGKAGTPTMGGILILIGILVPSFLWGDVTNYYLLIAMAATMLFGAVGFMDDYSKVARKRSLGMTGRKKIFFQIFISLAICAVLKFLASRNLYSTKLSLPFLEKLTPEMDRWSPFGIPLFMPLGLVVVFMVVGASNAVNLTDGLDGLAAGCVIIASSALTALCYVTGHARFADYLGLVWNVYASELTVFSGAMVGATMGFLWYNCHPAEVFMGDVGSLALGGAIGTVAVLIKQEFLLPMIGGVFVLEALSVILQVISYKFTGKRIFRMAPVHHHFELIGWKESKVVIRFWIAGVIFALLSLTTLKLR